MVSALVERLFEQAGQLDLDARLTALSGLPHDRLAAIRDGAPFSSTEYERLCRALAVDPFAFYAGEEARPNRALVRFRSAQDADLASAADVRTLSLAAEVGRLLGQLWTALGRPAPLADLRDFQAVQSSADIWREGYNLGERARAHLAGPTEPILDLERRLGELGIQVARVALGSPQIDAACIWEPGAVPIIVLNTKALAIGHAGARRAALAHELCHLLHDGGEDSLVTQVSREDPVGSYGQSVEVRARAFAPAFLAPRDQVRAWNARQKASIRDEERVCRLAEAWGLSFEGAAWHAKNAQILPAHIAEGWARSPGKPVVDLQAFEATPPPTPPSMIHPALPERAAPLWEGWATDLVLAALEEGLISLGRARELLTWS